MTVCETSSLGQINRETTVAGTLALTEGDFDGNGLSDIVVANEQTGSVRVF